VIGGLARTGTFSAGSYPLKATGSVAFCEPVHKPDPSRYSTAIDAVVPHTSTDGEFTS
jgi:hypothetical protein